MLKICLDKDQIVNCPNLKRICYYMIFIITCCYSTARAQLAYYNTSFSTQNVVIEELSFQK